MVGNIVGELKHLFWGELSSAIMFPMFYLYSINQQVVSFQWGTFMIVIVFSIILLEGTYYWNNLIKRFKQPERSLSRVQIGRVYSKLKILNWGLIAIEFLFFLLTAPTVGTMENLLRLGLILFTIIEQINYFYTRLSYYGKTRCTLQVIKPIKQMLTKTGRKAKIAEEINFYHQWCSSVKRAME